MKKKLCKIYSERKIFGVCAGLADYVNIDITLMRIIWVILILCFHNVTIIYIVLAIIMPYKDIFDNDNLNKDDR